MKGKTMNESTNPESQKKHGSFVRKAGLYGGAIGGLITITAIIFAFAAGSLPLLCYIAMPAHYVCSIFHYDPLAYNGVNSDFIDLLFLPTLVNSLLLFLLGLFVFFVISKFESKIKR